MPVHNLDPLTLMTRTKLTKIKEHEVVDMCTITIALLNEIHSAALRDTAIILTAIIPLEVQNCYEIVESNKK